ncbi:MAG: GGDEF domain-containing protein [Gammaproteobacteria bacterium]|nr:GGDEF domain-containing protein [Gammaproteobacteria bacterium]
MTNPDPVSDLSIKRSVDIYSFVILISFVLFLFWLADDRYDNFVDAHQISANKAVQVAAMEIKEIINNKRHVVSLFSEDNRDLIFKLSQYPDDEELYDELNRRLGRNIPDFFASNIVTSSGDLVIGDFDGKVGGLCLTDIKHFIDDGHQLVRVHPNNDTYHYDILTRLPDDKDGKLFFVSFNLNELSDLLHVIQPSMHELMLINEGMQNLIEINTNGGRNVITDRLDYRLTSDEISRIMSSTKIENSMWSVIDFHQPGLLTQYRMYIFKEYLFVFFVVAIIGLYMRSVLVDRDSRRNLAEIKLRQSNDEIRILNEKLELLATTDGLTGLYNRRYIDERLAMEWSRCQRTGLPINIVIIDIDYFKNYNDQYGHQAGDDCLISVANTMTSIFKRSGDIVARYGGEEFVIVMTDINVEAAELILHQFQNALNEAKIKHESSNVGDHLTVSIGLVNIIPTQSDSVQDGIRNADKALYVAKESGRNQIYVHK